ncbi:MAG: hypothetical protein QF554_09430 [Dehalococcoidia bacterium]|nr:hypothetical protein [Dehalococcoidia bacterium]
MDNLLIFLGAAAALGGLAWLGYVGAVMKGSKANALIGGISSVVVGGAIVVLGASITDDPGQTQQYVPDGSRFATATPAADPTAAAVIDPGELYRQEVNELTARAVGDLARTVQFLGTPNADSVIWVNEVRQTASQFARYAARAEDLVVPDDQAELQQQLVDVLGDLAVAGRQINDSLDAIKFQNVFVAQEAITEALATLSESSEVLADIGERTEPETS